MSDEKRLRVRDVAAIVLVIGGLPIVGAIVRGKNSPSPPPVVRPLPVAPVQQPVEEREPEVIAEQTCGEPIAQRGLTRLELLDGLSVKSVLAYIPSGYEPGRPHRLLVAVHDSAQSPEALLDVLQLRQFADEDNVVIVLPEDPSRIYTWQNADAKVEDAVAVARAKLCIKDGVRLLGYGDGANATEVLSCRTPGFRPEAVALIAYRRREGEPDCPSSAPTLHINALKDGRQPVGGGVGCTGGQPLVGLDAQEEYFRQAHHCEPPKTTFEHPDGVCQTWKCETPLVLCRVDGGRPIRGAFQIDACEGEASKFPYAERVWPFLFGPMTAD